SELKSLPARVQETIPAVDAKVREIAAAEREGRFFLYLGRNIGLPVCLEGALKMKEITYIPSDAYAAGEMKHGPIALLDESTPVPADAALYLDATVRPQGSTKEALTAALSKLLGTKDPGSYWISKLDQALAPDKLSYTDDVESWLGERAAVFFQTFGANPQGA